MGIIMRVFALFVFSVLFLGANCAVVKREAFSVKSSQLEEEEIFKNDILGEPLSEEDFKLSETIKEDEVEETRSQGSIDPILLAGMFEGDIRGINDTEGRNGIISRYKKWPGAVIPYVISSSYNRAERAVIARAMKFYHDNTCIRFKKRSNQRDYIHITRGNGCSSHVGRRGGVQYVSLGYGCVASGTIQHELMHAAGFWHEQSRHDRDRYVSIVWNNILGGLEYNFKKFTQSNTQTFGEPYDYKSVMHYGAYAFTKYRGRATIVPKQRGVSIGQRSQLSRIDLSKLKKLYECPGTSTGGGSQTTKKPTGTAATTKAPVIGTTGSNLVDRNQHCLYWARTGECTNNAKYMLSHCAKSCAKCSNGQQNSASCRDGHVYCPSWAASGQCRANPKYMLPNCKKSCKVCSSGC